MAEAYQCLASLRTMLHARRQEFMEMMAKGLEEGNHREYVGRCKQLASVIEMVNQQIKSVNGGEDDGSV